MATKLNPYTGQLYPYTNVASYQKYPTGSWQSFINTTYLITTGALNANYIVGTYIEIKEDVSINKVRINVTTPALGNCVVGVYELNTVGYPTTKLLEAEFDTNISGIQEITLSTAVDVVAGHYMYAVNSSSSANVRSMIAQGFSLYGGMEQTLPSNANVTGRHKGAAYSSLPDPWPVTDVQGLNTTNILPIFNIL